MADEPTIKLVQGQQRWLIVRTDRDGASAEEVAGMLAGFLQYIFRQLGADALEIFETGRLEWRIGAARPVKYVVEPTKEIQVLTAGAKVADSLDLDMYPTIEAQTPWYMVVELWWRGPDTEIRWPALKVSGIGWRSWTLDRADWLLLQSRIPEITAPDPGDQTWGEAVTDTALDALKGVGERIKEETSSIVKMSLGTAAVLVLVYSMLRRKKKG
jgi:hypothetical protein